MNIKRLGLLAVLLLASQGLLASSSESSTSSIFTKGHAGPRDQETNNGPDQNKPATDQAGQKGSDLEPKPEKATWGDTFSGYWKSAQGKFQELQTWAKENPRTAIVSALGVTVAAMVGYKLFIAKPSAPKLEIVPPSVGGMPLFASEKNDGKAERVADKAVAVPHWLMAAQEVANQAYSDLPRADRVKVLRPIVEAASRDPHSLLGNTELMTKLTMPQIVTLVGVFTEFTRERINKIYAVVIEKSSESTALKAMFESLASRTEENMFQLLRAFVEGNHLSPALKTFVTSELDKVIQWKQILRNFIEVYEIDTFVANDQSMRQARTARR